MSNPVDDVRAAPLHLVLATFSGRPNDGAAGGMPNTLLIIYIYVGAGTEAKPGTREDRRRRKQPRHKDKAM